MSDCTPLTITVVQSGNLPFLFARNVRKRKRRQASLHLLHIPKRHKRNGTCTRLTVQLSPSHGSVSRMPRKSKDLFACVEGKSYPCEDFLYSACIAFLPEIQATSRSKAAVC
ncbi:hypothetical protein XPA_006995 [Xanthoria parietina]